MKKFHLLMLMVLLAHVASAAKVVLASGKWSEQYKSNCIATDDQVYITGTVVLDKALTVEGDLIIEKGAVLIGMKDMIVSQTGSLENLGMIMLRSLTNNGTVCNKNLISCTENISSNGIFNNATMVMTGHDLAIQAKADVQGNGTYMSNNVILSENAVLNQPMRIYYTGEIINDTHADALSTGNRAEYVTENKTPAMPQR